MELTGPERGPHTLRGWLPWIAVGVVMVVLAGVAVLTLFLSDAKSAEEAENVDDVAGLAVEAAEELDIGAGIDLLCEAPMDLYRQTLETMINDARERSGTVDPAVDYAVSDVSDGATGSFVVEASSSEDGLEGQDLEVRVFVEEQDGRSCISGIGDVDDEEEQIRISGGGYSGARPPSPAPSATSPTE
ncbi:hypothetical protein FE634_01475 [Nocardioides dongxiaopingii]|jgi:hypothetical protein|uniref:hypothetical protein n=1 Tax=Nocardioides TaxID=1839 RepID=UPI0010C7682D|nr:MULTISPECIES: hypothetical protein [Nocardioides]QCW49420.1 hypothetical protein FE634_01475 [Nocardioides sp. S-1144]